MTGTATIPAIERSLDLNAAPERVWRALTDPDELARWLGQRCRLDATPGGSGWVEWDGHGRYAMVVDEVDEPRRFVARWMNEPDMPFDDARSTLLEWDLEPLPAGGTRLHLRESGFRTPRSRTANEAGWRSELEELISYLGGQA